MISIRFLAERLGFLERIMLVIWRAKLHLRSRSVVRSRLREIAH
jgi:hypothetical protein